MVRSHHQWPIFIVFWLLHTVYTILTKVVIFVILIQVEQVRGLQGVSLFGIASIVPVMVALPFLGLIIDRIHFKGFYIFNLFIQIPLIYLILNQLFNEEGYRFFLILVAFASIFILLETILFDKLTKLTTSKGQLQNAVSLSRLSTALAYFIGPLMASYSYHNNVEWLSLATILALILYGLVFAFLEKKDLNFNLNKPHENLKYFFKKGLRRKLSFEILFLYSVSFMWTNAIIIISFPYFNAFYSTSFSSFLIALSGAGGFLINILFFYLRFSHNILMYCRLTALLNSLMLILIGLFPGSKILAMVAMFLGGLFSTFCFILSQWIAQQAFSSRYIGTFLSLRTWLSTGVTAVFYLFSGFFLEKYIIPLIQKAVLILPGEAIKADNTLALSLVFILLGSIFATALIAYRMVPLMAFYRVKIKKKKLID